MDFGLIWRWKVPLICVALVALVWAVFGQTLHHQFVNYDDGRYVYENPVVVRGITPHGILWAFNHVHSQNWHPLTSITHMLDVQLYGLKAGGHHFTNILLHSMGSVLLFLVLQSMTGALWRCALVAAIFAVHPLHVESVAWIAERKDVLSAVFFMLTLGAYVRYVRRRSAARYSMVLICFALGLMCKPMLVTVPLLLLLLDYWPLGRLAGDRSGGFPRAPLLEKIPLFILSAGSIVATLIAQKGAIVSVESLPFAWRINNALVSCVIYIGQMIWPANLAVFYPHPADHLGYWKIAGAAALLLAITIAVFIFRKQHPYLVTGWFWYIGMLIPVLGVVQVGSQAHADRYTYLPQIGLFIAIAWGIADLSNGWPYRRHILALNAVATIVALAWIARIQTSYWRDGETLWTRAVAVTSGNYVAQNNLGFVLMERGAVDESIPRFRAALEINPRYTDAEYNLANSLLRKEKPDEAIAHYENVLQIQPDYIAARTNLANLLLELGRGEEAMAEYRKAVDAQPNSATAQYNLGIAFLRAGELDQAIPRFETALTIETDYPDAHYALGTALSGKGRVREAIAHWRRELELRPNDSGSASMLAWALATSPDDALRDGAKAIKLTERALKDSQEPTGMRALAAAYAEAGRFSQAVDTAERGISLATAQHQTELVDQLKADINEYRANRPVREQ